MKKTKSIQDDNEPGKFHRNDNFTEFYWDVDDTTGTTNEKKFVGRQHDDKGWEIATKLNNRINKDFNKGKIK